jgi:hypothetical protein
MGCAAATFSLPKAESFQEIIWVDQAPPLAFTTIEEINKRVTRAQHLFLSLRPSFCFVMRERREAGGREATKYLAVFSFAFAWRAR